MVGEIEGARKGGEISTFLKTFEGAAATFGEEDQAWSLWLPEVNAGDRPITPASQLYFAVILRHEDQAFAIRFFYDCSTGKIRYYTSAVPREVAEAPEFENAVSELFRHTLPVEPIRQRKLRSSPNRRRREKNAARREEAPQQKREIPAVMADPVVVTPPVNRLEERAATEEPRTEAASAVDPQVEEFTKASEPAENALAATKDPIPTTASAKLGAGENLPRPAPALPVAKTESVRKPEAEAAKSAASRIERASEPLKEVKPIAEPLSKPASSQLSVQKPSVAAAGERKAVSSVWSVIDSKALAVSTANPTPTREVAIEPRPEMAVALPAEPPRVAQDFDGVRKVEFDVGARMRSVLMSVIYACGIVATVGILAYTYLVFTEDAGVKHHRLQNEALRSQAGR